MVLGCSVSYTSSFLIIIFSCNWLGGILIIVSLHIHFNKLLMPLSPVWCFANLVQGLQFPSLLIIFKPTAIFCSNTIFAVKRLPFQSMEYCHTGGI